MAAPKNLLIYYGWTNSITGTSSDLDTAIAEFARYDTVVIAGSIVKPDHGNHEFTKALVNSPELDHVEFYGYVDTTWEIRKLTNRIDLWSSFGVDGVFFDKYGYDYQNSKTGEYNSREKHNCLLYYLHSQTATTGKKMRAFVNAWNQKHVFDSQDGLRCLLNKDDISLLESFAVKEGRKTSVDELQHKIDHYEMYKGLARFAAIPTTFVEAETANGTTIDYDVELFNYSFMISAAIGMDLFGWGEDHYAAKGGNPWRPRPVPTRLISASAPSQSSKAPVLHTTNPDSFIARINVETGEYTYAVSD